MKQYVITFLFCCSTIVPQIDTTEWFPVENGNYWIYQDKRLPDRVKVSIDGETTLSNGKKYKIFKSILPLSSEPVNDYRRVEDNSRVYQYNSADTDFLTHDFNCPLNESWIMYSLEMSEIHRRVTKVDTVWSDIFIAELPMMEFTNMYTVNGDTVYFEREWQQIYKGVGIVKYGEFGSNYELLGAQINGQVYGDITGIEEETVQPADFVLEQNYPNPFNPATVISYRLSAIGKTTLKIYDILGREVATLVDAEQKPGTYNVNFDGSSLSSGVYFYQLKAGDFITTRKMLLLK